MKKLNCVLLVDDNPGDNYYNQFIIKATGVCQQIQTAQNGLEALSYLKNSVEQDQFFPIPDIIFLDINMPRMNGFEFLEEFKKLDDQVKSQIQIVMLTTSINPEDMLKAQYYKEVKKYVHKPLTEEMLQQILQRYF